MTIQFQIGQCREEDHTAGYRTIQLSIVRPRSPMSAGREVVDWRSALIRANISHMAQKVLTKRVGHGPPQTLFKNS